MSKVGEYPKRIHIKITLEQWRRVQEMRKNDRNFSISEMFRNWFDDEYMGGRESEAGEKTKGDADVRPNKTQFQFNVLSST